MTIKTNEPAPAQDMASALLGIAGVTVTEAEADGLLSVWAQVTGPAACPACAVISDRVHEQVVTRPQDVRYGDREIGLFLVKRRLECAEEDCPRGTFTEWVPQVPPRCQVTRRLLEHAGSEVTGRGITPAQRDLLAVRARRVRGTEGGAPAVLPHHDELAGPAADQP